MSRSWAARFVVMVFSLQTSLHTQTASSPVIPTVRQIEITSSLSKLGQEGPRESLVVQEAVIQTSLIS